MPPLARRAGGAAPFGLVQEYLNAADDTLWGLAANGLVLRIARDNPSLTRPAYIEIDLGATFEDGLYADFAAFWLLAHASALQGRAGSLASSSILERWRGQAQESGERARDKLRDGVTQALITLGHGFVTHPANDRLRGDLAAGRLSASDLHQELLRLVYRCLFLLTIEDRGLLHPPGAAEDARRLYHDGYGLGSLRERALRPRAYDAFTDLWQGLRITFRALASGADVIAAPALGGLFEPSQCPNLDAAELANAGLLTAIRALAFFPSGRTLARINYRDMNTEEFGSVYESLLELHPVLQTAPWRFGYVGVNGHGAKGSERKLSGSYYTPAPLVHELIKSALEPVIRRPPPATTRTSSAARCSSSPFSTPPAAPVISCWRRRGASRWRSPASMPPRTRPPKPSASMRCARSSATASTASTATRSRSSCARPRCGSRRSSPAGRSPSSTTASAVATPSSASSTWACWRTASPTARTSPKPATTRRSPAT